MHTTSFQRRFDVLWRRNDVETTSCIYRELFHYFHNSFCVGKCPFSSGVVLQTLTNAVNKAIHTAATHSVKKTSNVETKVNSPDQGIYYVNPQDVDVNVQVHVVPELWRQARFKKFVCIWFSRLFGAVNLEWFKIEKTKTNTDWTSFLNDQWLLLLILKKCMFEV